MDAKCALKNKRLHEMNPGLMGVYSPYPRTTSMDLLLNEENWKWGEEKSLLICHFPLADFLQDPDLHF